MTCDAQRLVMISFGDKLDANTVVLWSDCEHLIPVSLIAWLKPVESLFILIVDVMFSCLYEIGENFVRMSSGRDMSTVIPLN